MAQQRSRDNVFLTLVPSQHGGGHDMTPPTPDAFENFDTSRFDLDWIVAEYEKQVTVADAQKDKTVYAMRLVAEMHNAGHLTKQDSISLVVALDETVRFPDELGQIYAAAAREQVLLFIDQIHKLVRTGAKNIALEVNRSLYPPLPLVPPKRGFLLRLIFGEE